MEGSQGVFEEDVLYRRGNEMTKSTFHFKVLGKILEYQLINYAVRQYELSALSFPSEINNAEVRTPE